MKHQQDLQNYPNWVANGQSPNTFSWWGAKFATKPHKTVTEWDNWKVE